MLYNYKYSSNRGRNKAHPESQTDKPISAEFFIFLSSVHDIDGVSKMNIIL